MEGRLLIRDCAVWQAGGVLVGRSVLIDGETISAIDAPDVLKARPGDWVADARGRLVTPGSVAALPDEPVTAAQHQLRVANALRHGVTCLVGPGGPALGARVIMPSVEADPITLQQSTFGLPFGRVENGCAADLVLWDVVPGPDFAFPQLTNALTAWVIVAGRVVVREGQLVGADFVAIASAATAR